MTSESPVRPITPVYSVPVWCQTLLVALLVGSGLIVSMIGNLASPRSMPDERHHYAMIKYAAEQGWFFDYAEIRTDPAGVENHLAHPPLYYWLLGLVYRATQPDRHFTQLGREHDRYGSPESHRVVIPLLRGVSHWLVFLGLFGIYRLVVFLMRLRWLTPATALIFVGTVAYIPGFLYIAAGLNNDVLVLALWPFLTQSTLTWMVQRCMASCWQTLALLALAVLSKATLWMLVLVLALLTLFSLRALFRANPPGTKRALVSMCWPDLASRFWSGFALLILGLALLHLGANVWRYGSPQPNYHDIFEITPQESKFYLDPTTRAFAPDWHRIGPRTWLSLSQTTLGFVGHTERVLRRYSITGPAWLLAGMLLATIVVLWQADRREDPRLGIWLLCGLSWLLQFALLWLVNIDFYREFSRIAAEGRYLIGYLQLAILGTAMVATRPALVPRLNRVLAWVALFILAFVLCRPALFFNHTWEYVRRSSIVEVIDRQLRSDGYQSLPWSSVKSRDGQAVLQARQKNGIPKHVLLTGRKFELIWDHSWPGDAGLLEVVLWVQAAEPSVGSLRLRLEEHESNRFHQNPSAVGQVLRFGMAMETYPVSISTKGSQPGTRPRLQLTLEQGLSLQLFGCFYRWRDSGGSNPEPMD